MFTHPIQPNKWKQKYYLMTILSFVIENWQWLFFPMFFCTSFCSWANTKICEPCVVISLKHALIFEWYMTNFTVENEHQQHTCHIEIVMCVQNVDTWMSEFPIRSNNQNCYVELEVSTTWPYIYLTYPTCISNYNAWIKFIQSTRH